MEFGSESQGGANGIITSTMRRAAHPCRCARCGAGVGVWVDSFGPGFLTSLLGNEIPIAEEKKREAEEGRQREP